MKTKLYLQRTVAHTPNAAIEHSSANTTNIPACSIPVEHPFYPNYENDLHDKILLSNLFIGKLRDFIET